MAKKNDRYFPGKDELEVLVPALREYVASEQRGKERSRIVTDTIDRLIDIGHDRWDRKKIRVWFQNNEKQFITPPAKAWALPECLHFSEVRWDPVFPLPGDVPEEPPARRQLIINMGKGVKIGTGKKMTPPIPVIANRISTESEDLMLEELLPALNSFPESFYSSKTGGDLESFQITCTDCDPVCENKCMTKIRVLDDGRIQWKCSRICRHWPICAKGDHWVFSETWHRGESLKHHANHPFSKIGRFIYRMPEIDIECPLIAWVMGQSYSKRMCREISYGDSLSLEAVIENLPGHKILVLEPESWQANPSMPRFRGRGLKSSGWLPPWGRSALELCNYSSLDGSFQALFPYVYSVPLAIRANESLPVGVFFAPTERASLFRIFLELAQRGGLLDKPVLTDEGSGIASALAGYLGAHFLCYMHLLRKLGFATPIERVAKKLLYCTTLERYRVAVRQAVIDVKALRRHGLVSNEQVVTFANIFGFSLGDNKEIVVPEGVDHAQGLWVRASLGVSTTTGHQKRFHREMNRLTKNARLFSVRLAEVCQAVTDDYRAYCEGHRGRQAREKLSFLRAEQKTRRIEPQEKCPLGCRIQDAAGRRFILPVSRYHFRACTCQFLDRGK